LAFNLDDILDDVSLPKWARWIAQDADGVWWAYEVEPLQFHKGWYENEVGLNKRLGQGVAPLDYKKTLKRINYA
jgi:hypothetical protein